MPKSAPTAASQPIVIPRDHTPNAKGVSRLYRPRPGLTPLLVVIAAGLIATIAVVWMTPALRDLAELLWLKLTLLAEIHSVAPVG